jgi:hypothetical protein
MTGPQRIRLSRTRGWCKPPSAAVVTRSTPYGNPFTVADVLALGCPGGEAEATAVAVNAHREWLDGKGEQDVYVMGRRVLDRRWVLANLYLLTGRDLLCWCPLPGPGQVDVCHAATLLELANGGAA